MSEASVPDRGPQTRLNWLLWTVRFLSLVAIGLAGILTWATLGGSAVPGCDPTSGFDCNAALASRWAKWFGVPVLWIGAACYAAVFLSSWGLARRSERLRNVSWHVFVFAALVAAGAGFWFLGLQLTGQSSLCPYCIGIHASGLAIATAVGVYLLAARAAEQRQSTSASISGLRTALSGRGAVGLSAVASSLPPPPLQIAFAGVLLAMVALVVGQVLFAPPGYEVAAGSLDRAIDLNHTSESDLQSDREEPSLAAGRHEVLKVDSEKESSSDPAQDAADSTEASNGIDTVAELTGQRRRIGSRKVSFLQGKLTLDLYEHPVLGRPDAKYVVLELFDYTCPHCRKMHKLIKEALPQFGDQLAVVVLPIPLDVLCNKLVKKQHETHEGACKIANLAVAMNRLDPVAFAKLHDWLMDREKTASYPQCLSYALERSNNEELLGELSRADVAERVQHYIETYAALNSMGKSSLPMIIIGDDILTGEYASASELRQVWEERLGIKAGQ